MIKHGSILGMRARRPMKVGSDMEMQNDGEKTVLSIGKYPELQNAKVGSPVSGSWDGTVESIDGDKVTVAYSSLDINTENSADKEMDKMRGAKSGVPADDQSEDY